MHLTLRFFVALAALASGLAAVGIFTTLIDRKYPIPEAQPVVLPQFYSEEDVPPPIVTDDWPLHWPRLANTRLALPGDAVNDEKATNGFENWFGLYRAGRRFEVRPASVSVTRFHDEERDDPGQKSGRRYMVQGSAKPLFLLKGIPGIRTGEVTTVFNGSNNGEVDGEPLNGSDLQGFDLGDESYQMWVSGAKPGRFTDKEGGIAYLSGDTVTQELYDHERRGNEDLGFDTYKVAWAGDIDRDGKLDLLMEYVIEGEATWASRFVLYISSQAKPGELVAPVAAFSNGGGC